MEIFYHGTCYLFNKFSPDFSGKGEGKAKYGRGIYVTSSYATAARYAAKAGKNNGLDKFYVYTVEIPDIKPDKHIFSLRPVNAAIVEKVEKAIGETIPDEVKAVGKLFRKYLGNLLTGQRATIKKMMSKADGMAESAVAQFLNKIGIVYLAWPLSQTKPGGDTNRAVLNATDISIVKIEQVEIDAKNKLIEGTEREITL